MEAQIEPSLEQNDRHGDLHKRLQQITKVPARIELPRYRADDKAGRGENDDGRNAEAPRNPLRGETDTGDERYKLYDLMVHGVCDRPPAAGVSPEIIHCGG